MPFDLMSGLKSFLQDRSVICWLAILLEVTIARQGSVSLPHWLKDNFTQDESPVSLTRQASVCCGCSLPALTGEERHTYTYTQPYNPLQEVLII